MNSHLKLILLLVHYWFPVILGWSIILVIQQATSYPIIASGKYLYLLGICAAYSLDRLLDNSNSTNSLWLKGVLSLGFIFSSFLGFILALQLSIKTFSVIIIFSLASIFYRKTKKYPLMKTLLVSIIWGWASVALPFANNNWFAWQFWTLKVSLPLVMFISAGCILCDFKDIATDNSKNIKSLPVILGIKKALWVTSLILLLTATISFYQGRVGILFSCLLLILVAQFPALISQESIGPLIVDLILAIPGLLISLHFI